MTQHFNWCDGNHLFCVISAHDDDDDDGDDGDDDDVVDHNHNHD